MTRQVFQVSDLTGEVIENPEDATKLIVEHHPAFPGEQIELDVLPEQVEPRLTDAGEYVSFSYLFPGQRNPQHFVLSVDEFAELFPQGNMEEALRRALDAQTEEEGRRRGRRGRRAAGERRQRIDYSSPERAGEPHPGRITEAEKEYVRNNLAEVNRRLREKNMREIDPTDPQMAERYDLSATAEDTVEEEQLQG